MDRTSFPPIRATEATRLVARKKLLAFLEKRLSQLGEINPDKFFENMKQKFRKDGVNDIDSIILSAELLGRVTKTKNDFEEKISLLKALISKSEHNTEA